MGSGRAGCTVPGVCWGGGGGRSYGWENFPYIGLKEPVTEKGFLFFFLFLFHFFPYKIIVFS